MNWLRRYATFPVQMGTVAAVLTTAVALAIAVSLTRPATHVRVAVHPASPRAVPPVKIAHSVQTKPNAQAKSDPVPAKPAPPPAPSVFEKEAAMSFHQRMSRWDSLIAEASRKYSVPQLWIRAVMQAESGGRTMSSETQPIVSTAGAMGLMQLMPQTYRDMRLQYGLGTDPFDPHDNIMAGAAYLRFLRSKYRYPAMFAAYNDGPGNLEARLVNGGLLPVETQLYVARVTNTLQNGGVMGGHGSARFTRPNGDAVMLNTAAIIGVRAAFPGEYAPGVQTVVTVGRVHQGVRESLAQTKAIIRAHGGGV